MPYMLVLAIFFCSVSCDYAYFDSKIRSSIPLYLCTSAQRNVILCGVTNDILVTQQEDVNWIRSAVVELIEDSWYNIAKILPPTTLSLCENDLKGALSLLVLAIVNNVAESSNQNKKSVETLLKAADGNDDGQLTFIEWIEWLGKSTEVQSYPILISTSISSPFSRKLLLNLKHALDCAISSVVLAARITGHPSLLIAAFVAGGMSSGNVQSASFGQALVSRVAPEVRWDIDR